MTPGSFKDGYDLIVLDAGKLLEEVRDVMAFLQPVKKRLNSNTSACKAGFPVHHVRPDADDVFHGMILPRANLMTICAGEAAHPSPLQGEASHAASRHPLDAPSLPAATRERPVRSDRH